MSALEAQSTALGAQELVWSPAPSPGGALGALLSGAAAACTGALLAVFLDTRSVPSAVLASVLLACTGGVAVMAAVGTWQRIALRYVLAPGALEVRGAGGRLRIRYDEVVRVVSGISAQRGRRPTLWPGAHSGYIVRDFGRGCLWRGTTGNPDHAILIDTGSCDYVLTPAEAGAFREQLIQRASAAPIAAPAATKARASWVDRLAGLDGWFRAMLIAGLAVATLGLRLDVARGGMAQPEAFKAAGILALNSGMGLAFIGRSAAIGRLLAGVALVAEIVATLW